MSGAVRRFACTQCGKCCNRSPEVELSEAAALADVFVFRLLFRLYSLPRAPRCDAPGGLEVFFQKKRLLAAHAARTYPKKVMRGGKVAEHTNYLMISALALDTRPAACAALDDGRCSIHERRPLGCRTVPFHYARADGLAASDFDSFVATPGYRCDTSAGAGLFLRDGRIVDRATVQARADALALTEGDRAWKSAIARRMKNSGDELLPSLQTLEANSGLAAMTTSMRVGWELAVEAGLLSREACRFLIEQQLATMDREIQRSECSATDWQTLQEMRTEYRSALQQPSGAYPASASAISRRVLSMP